MVDSWRYHSDRGPAPRDQRLAPVEWGSTLIVDAVGVHDAAVAKDG